MIKHRYYQKRRQSPAAAITLGLILVLILAIVFGKRLYGGSLAKKSDDSQDTTLPAKDTTPAQAAGPSQPAAAQTKTAHLTHAMIDLVFIPQAPIGVWDALHEDACEEASFLMIKHYLDKTPAGNTTDMDSEIKALIDFESSKGCDKSITLEQLAKIAAARYGLTGRIKPASIENIETDIAAGHPVIIPAAGKLLKNPNFKNGGPNYHMLVVKGYDSTNFITNDPGTRKGEGYTYDKTTFLNAIHNWDPADILNGQAVYLVF